MNKDEYKKLVDGLTPKENKSKNAIIAFLVGGLVGLLAELIAVLIISLGEKRVLCLFGSQGYSCGWCSGARWRDV